MFAFCIESSHARGLGHLYRSLTLAAALQRQGGVVRYLMNDHTASVELVRQRGYEVDAVDLSASDGWESRWLAAHDDVRVWIDDRLNTTRQHAQVVKTAGVSLATFDDRGDGAALADLHVAALAFQDTHLLQGKTILRGVDYLLLDPQLAQWRRPRDVCARWLITMGGADTWGVTPLAMQALLERGVGATVVLGPAFLHGDAVDAVLACAPKGRFTVYREGVPSLYEEMFRHDVAITAGGMTPFQANAIGMPCVVVATEVFEVPVAQELERMGGSLFSGFRTDIDWSILDHPQPWGEMSRAGIQAMDLQGCGRVCNALRTLAGGRA